MIYSSRNNGPLSLVLSVKNDLLITNKRGTELTGFTDPRPPYITLFLFSLFPCSGLSLCGVTYYTSGMVEQRNSIKAGERSQETEQLVCVCVDTFSLHL